MHQCIPKKSTCDTVNDCIDGSDEWGCKCVDYLVKLKPQLACDTYPDCGGWEDESPCKFCNGKEQFFCDLSRKCLPKSKV